jgi:asparagine synthase (glutamine-hydrolysing)
MCGINFLIRNKQASEAIQQMMQVTSHRGPDHANFYVHHEKLAFAGNRLKILDLSDASNQPFWSMDGQQALVWNGALYNYQDLRNRLLEAGFVFKTNSDTEVLLHWLIHKGVDGLQECQGMYSLAFIDFTAEKVILLRDLSGEKPLYYWNEKNEWLFSSEQRGILAGLPHRPVIEAVQVEAYVSLRHTLPHAGLFEGVKQMLPGQGLVIDFAGNVLDKISLSTPAFTQERNQLTFEDLLKDAVLNNFHTERPVGLILSGGVDSSLVYALWYEETMQPMPTFTATFEERYQHKYSDPKYVKQLQNFYPSLHYPVLITLADVMNSWEDYIAQLDIPVGDSASFLTWMIAKEAKKEVQVLISGAGADELFAGYTRHLAYTRYLKNPGFFLFLKKFNPLWSSTRSLAKFFSSIGPNLSDTYINMAALGLPEEELLAKLRPSYPHKQEPLKAALDWDRQIYLVNDVLKIHDNACMAHGIEGRAPYLSQDLLSLSQTMTEQEHLQQLGKQWLKEALQKRGLQSISQRKKLGFGLPLEEWMHQKEFQQWVFSAITRIGSSWESYFPEHIRRFVREPNRIPKHQFLLVWNLFILLSWLDKHA